MRGWLWLCVSWAALAGCRREQTEVPHPLANWDQCLARVDTFEPLPESATPLGTSALDDAGCEWVTSVADGGTRTLSHHKVFGTLRQLDSSAPDVRVIGHRAVSSLESFEWFDPNGDGHHEYERRATFGTDGKEQRVEQTFWNAAGLPLKRDLSTRKPGEWHNVDQLFLDGGWITTGEQDVTDRCEYQPIEPMRVLGK